MSILAPDRTPRERSTRSRLYILLPLSILAFVITITSPPQVTDDAYITYRYVRNIVSDQGFVYNTGERVLGTTTPLYTCLLATLTHVVPRSEVVQLSLAISAVSDALSTFILFQLAYCITRSKWNSAFVALLFALFPFRVAVARNGMETPFFVLMILASMYFYLSGRHCLSAVFSGLGALTRPEGSLLVLLILSLLLVSRKRFPWLASLTVMGVLLPWLLFSAWYFGSPLPNSVVAKATAYVMVSRFEFVPIVVRFWGGAPFWGPQTVPRLIYSLINGIFLISLYILVLWQACREGSKALVVWGYPALFVLAFTYANPFMLPWYLAPLLPFWLLGLGKGILTLSNMIAGKAYDPKRHLLVVVTLLVAQVPALDLVSKVQLGPPTSQREDLYRALAIRLNEQVLGGSVIAASEIGALGYHSSAYILDTVGLVSPYAIPYNPAQRSSLIPPYAIPTELILDHRPEYVVSLEVFVRDTLSLSTEFSEEYDLLERIDTSAFGSNGLLVFRRRD
jgi:hypothetical protein